MTVFNVESLFLLEKTFVMMKCFKILCLLIAPKLVCCGFERIPRMELSLMQNRGSVERVEIRRLIPFVVGQFFVSNTK